MRSLTFRLLPTLFVFSVFAFAQDQQPARTSSGTPIKINYLNVCTPTDAEKHTLADALARIPRQARFGSDFEISRGRSTMPEAPVANWVRIRREFPDGFFSSVQYSLSVDENGMVETLVFRVRDPGELLLVTMDDSVSAVTGVAAVLAQNTPAEHVRIERFGKSSVALRRCPRADQSALEPLFRSASEIMAAYRVALKVRTTVPGELARLGAVSQSAANGKKAAASPKSEAAVPPAPADRPN
ncbi:MAG: hypothetical protein L0099_12415 [Acidobacteria bacterium]|nr:hypothetical protein [Acidobacteriota bacterium]